MCSWVNSGAASLKTPPTDLASFSPQKKAKGLVFYSDRRDELEGNPSLAVYSSPSPDKRTMVQEAAKAVDPTAEVDVAVVLDFAEAKEADGDVSATPSADTELALTGRKRRIARVTSHEVTFSGADRRASTRQRR